MLYESSSTSSGYYLNLCSAFTLYNHKVDLPSYRIFQSPFGLCLLLKRLLSLLSCTYQNADVVAVICGHACHAAGKTGSACTNTNSDIKIRINDWAKYDVSMLTMFNYLYGETDFVGSTTSELYEPITEQSRIFKEMWWKFCAIFQIPSSTTSLGRASHFARHLGGKRDYIISQVLCSLIDVLPGAWKCVADLRDS